MKSLVTIGTFDGVHRGHQRLLRALVAVARRRRLAPHVVLFRRPPRHHFQPAAATSLMTTVAERKDLLRSMGIRRATALTFGPRWARLSHDRFFHSFLLGRCRAGGLLVGPDFAFGKGRLGNVDWLRRACQSAGVHFQVHQLVRLGGGKISSSRIRTALAAGEVESAARHLGRPYRVSGRVIHGKGLGGKIGIPTANLDVSPEKILPRGVFAVRVRGPKSLGTGRRGVCNIGTRPTVDASKAVHVEIHIPRFSGSLYGTRLEVDFLRKLRGERKFASLDALTLQIRRDIAAAGR